MRWLYFSLVILFREVAHLDRMILGAGIAMAVLGLGFLIANEMISGLHSAYVTGGYMWLIIGGITAGVGVKVNREKQKELEALR